MSGIHPLAEHDPRGAPQPSVQLAAAHVERVDLRSAGLEEAVGEASGARAHIRADRAPDVELEVAEGGLELEPPTGDIGHRLALEADLRFRRDAGAGLVHALVVHHHLAGEDHRLSLCSGRGEAELDEEDVEALLLRTIRHRGTPGDSCPEEMRGGRRRRARSVPTLASNRRRGGASRWSRRTSVPPRTAVWKTSFAKQFGTAAAGRGVRTRETVPSGLASGGRQTAPLTLNWISRRSDRRDGRLVARFG